MRPCTEVYDATHGVLVSSPKVRKSAQKCTKVGAYGIPPSSVEEVDVQRWSRGQGECATMHNSAQKCAPTALLRPPWRRWRRKGGAEDRTRRRRKVLVDPALWQQLLQALRKRPANVQATFCVLRAEAIHWARDVLRAEAIHWACEWKASTRMPKPFSFRS